MKTTRFVWTCSSTCFVFLTCLLTWLLHQFLWPIFFLLDYLIYCSVSFPLPTLTQLVHNLMPLFNSLLSALTPFPFAKVFLLRSPFSKGEVFWSFFQRFFLQLSFSQWFIFHHVPKAEKGKQIWAINLLQYNDLITFGKGTIQIYECSCEFNHRFLDLDAIVHYIVFFL